MAVTTKRKKDIANAGLNFKTRLTDQLEVVGTVNPDFRNIQDDILSLDFSNFERLGNESRPFFQEGSDYYFFGRGQRIFASQRIPVMDLGVNIYGNLDGDSRLGFLNTFDFGEESVSAGSYTYNPDPLTEFTGSFALLQRPDENNEAGRFAASRRFGDWSVFGSASVTNDEERGSGTATSLSTSWNTPGWRANLNFTDVSEDFFPRAGFARETDLTGFSGSIRRDLEYSSGPISQAEVDISFLDYNRKSGGHYRESTDLGIELSFNNTFEVDLGAEYEHFLDRHDHIYNVGFSFPQGNPYRRVGVGYAVGEINDQRYESFGISARYRPIKRIQLSLRGQAVKYFEQEELIVMYFNWEMDRFQSIGGRAVWRDDRWNWFASYRLSGNEGAEYFLILGDPNASSFQKTLILKVTIPLAIGG